MFAEPSDAEKEAREINLKSLRKRITLSSVEIQMLSLLGKIFSIFNLIIIAVMISSPTLYANKFEDQVYTSTQ